MSSRAAIGPVSIPFREMVFCNQDFGKPGFFVAQNVPANSFLFLSVTFCQLAKSNAKCYGLLANQVLLF